MTWTPPTEAPASYTWLETADHNAVQPQHFLIVCQEWIAWQLELGVTDPIQDPATFFDVYTDLQNFANVVSWWPKEGVPTNLRAPTLAGMVTLLRPGPNNGPETFAEHLARRVDGMKAFIRTKGGDTENPNETAAERAARKNRERQQRFQLKHAAGSDDPAKHALIEVAKSEAAKLSEWKAYLRKYVKDQKLACDAAVRAAKQLRDDNISAAEQAIVDQEVRMLAAKAAVDNYRINN